MAQARVPITPDAAVAFLKAMQERAEAQPDQRFTYHIGGGTQIGCTYNPPRRNGRIDLKSVQYPELCFDWSLFLVADYDRAAGMDYPEEYRGWSHRSKEDAQRLLEGETVAEQMERHIANAEAVFARIARS